MDCESIAESWQTLKLSPPIENRKSNLAQNKRFYKQSVAGLTKADTAVDYSSVFKYPKA